MKLKRLLSVLDVLECTADPELDVRDISFDSRTTQPGDLFAAVCCLLYTSPSPRDTR